LQILLFISSPPASYTQLLTFDRFDIIRIKKATLMPDSSSSMPDLWGNI